MKKQIINIVNFVRTKDQRYDYDLFQTMVNQLEMLREKKLKATFLLQYDAILDRKYTDKLKEYSELIEIGIWFEIIRQTTDAAGIEWHGRDMDWDWNANVCSPVGYTLPQRKKLTDVYMNAFKNVFSSYPASVGAWALDAYTLDYMASNYPVDATCNCKDQCGTDGYNLWGGYYNQAYYPVRKNSFCPANTIENQINIPVFRMLGSDPIYQYDDGLSLENGAAAWQQVITLEPSYENYGGGNADWVNWFMKENFSGKCLNFGYAQAGQENSFSWEQMKFGFAYQMNKIAEMEKSGTVDVLTLGESGRWYKNQYKTTPPTTIVAETDWKGQGHKTFWFNSKNYRANILCEYDKFWIRDIFMFHEEYCERYLDSECTGHVYYFDNLPVMDGNCWSGKGVRAGIYPCMEIGGRLSSVTGEMTYSEKGQTAIVTFNTEHFGRIKFIFSEIKITINIQKNFQDFLLVYRVGTPPENNIKVSASGTKLLYRHNDFDYSISLENALFSPDENIVIKALKNSFSILFKE